ncbi:MAG: hypothetical protein R2860_02515 [Desulfobacterales bacterium]
MDAIKRYSAIDASAMNDIKKYTQNMLRGYSVFVQKEAAGLEPVLAGLEVKLDVLSMT